MTVQVLRNAAGYEFVTRNARGEVISTVYKPAAEALPLLRSILRKDE